MASNICIYMFLYLARKKKKKKKEWKEKSHIIFNHVHEVL